MNTDCGRERPGFDLPERCYLVGRQERRCRQQSDAVSGRTGTPVNFDKRSAFHGRPRGGLAKDGSLGACYGIVITRHTAYSPVAQDS
ncbi:hypothetical protein ACWIG5_42185, partial [Streptomyces lydicus]